MRALFGLLIVPIFALAPLAAPKAVPNAADATQNAAAVTETCPSTVHQAMFGLPSTLDFSLSDGWNGSVRLDRVNPVATVWDSSQESLTCTYGTRHNEPTVNTYVLVKSFSGRGCSSNGLDFPTITCAR